MCRPSFKRACGDVCVFVVECVYDVDYRRPRNKDFITREDTAGRTRGWVSRRRVIGLYPCVEILNLRYTLDSNLNPIYKAFYGRSEFR